MATLPPDLAVDVEEVHVDIRMPPKHHDPGAVEDLVPANGPPAGFRAPDQPNRPPSPG